MAEVSEHKGVECDSCGESPIKGTRYKCTICQDFDLCATCKTANATPDSHLSSHKMIAYNTPLVLPVAKPRMPRFEPGMK